MNVIGKSSAMLCRHNKTLLRCLAFIPVIIFLDILGVFTHFFEKDFETDFYYPLQQQDHHHHHPSSIQNAAFNYSFVRQPTISMGATRLTLLIKSSTKNAEQRKAIRETWGYENRFSDVNIKRVFLLGLPNGYDEDTQKLLAASITKESLRYGDIMQANFHDAYFNNTLKTMSGIRWASERYPHSDYYMFVDDDYYVSMKNVLRLLGNSRRSRHPNSNDMRFIGYVFQTSPLRHKFSKWYVSLAEYPFDKWPPYVTAGAFILSREALLKMYSISKKVPLFRFDDIYLGIVALKAGIKVQHCDNFYFGRPRYRSPDSYSNVIASHGFDDPSEMINIWNECRSANYA